MAEDSISRKFIPDYLTLRSSIKTNLKFGVWAFLKENSGRTDDKIKALLLDLFIVKIGKSPNKNTRAGRKKEKSELSDDRYLFANNIESILTLSSFKAEDLVAVTEVIRDINARIAAKDITDLIHESGSSVEDLCDDHSMSIVKVGKTKATKYKLNDVLDLSEEERIMHFLSLDILNP